MRCFAPHRALVLTLTVLVGCAGTRGSSPLSPDSDLPPATQYGLQSGESSLVGLFDITLDRGTLEATVTPRRAAAAQPPQALTYDFDIANFLTAETFRIVGIHVDGESNIRITFQHGHPFPAPDLAQPISATNRADLGYTGRLLILADDTPTSYFAGEAVLDPNVVLDPAGYLQPGDLLASAVPPPVNTFPYVLLIDEAEDSRVGVSNGGDPRGNFDPVLDGWQLSNLGPNANGWTGYDYLHGGQTSQNSFTLNAEALGDPEASFAVAVVIKYTDPRGLPGRNLRFPPNPSNAEAFAYRLPYAAMDCSVLEAQPTTLTQVAGATAPINVRLRDWDTEATEAGDADLSDELDVGLIEPDADGPPSLDLDPAGFEVGPLALLPGTQSGAPGDEIVYTATLTNTNALTPGEYLLGLRAIDPSEATDDSGYHFGVDPETVLPTRTPLLERTYQIQRVTVTELLPPPELSAPQPIIVESFKPTTFTILATNNPTEWSWDFGDGALPRFSTEATPTVTPSRPGYYLVHVEASNASGMGFYNFNIDTRIGDPPVWSTAAIPDADLTGLAMVVNDGTEIGITGFQDGALHFLAGESQIPASGILWTHYVLDPEGSSAPLEPTSLTLAGTKYAVAYYSDAANALRFARSTSPGSPAGPGDWSLHSVVDFTAVPSVGVFAGLHAAAGRFMLAYNEPSAQHVMFAQAFTHEPSGAPDWEHHLQLLEGSPAGPIRVDELFDKPLAVYPTTDEGGGVRYTWSPYNIPIADSEWFSHLVVPGTSERAAVTVANLHPFIAFADSTTQQLFVARSRTPFPVAPEQWFIHRLTTADAPGETPDLSSVDGRLFAGSWQSASGELEIFRAEIPLTSGPGDWLRAVVDGGGGANVGRDVRIAPLPQGMVFVYRDVINATLRVAIGDSTW